MSHVESGPLATYSSLQDKHLVGYFNNSRMRRHLRRSGLVTRNGEIITENSFRLNMARKEHQKHVRDLMAQAIVHKALDMERHRQSQIKRKLEEISKVELVQRVRSTRGRKGDEDITPYLSPRAPGARPKSAKQERPRSVVSGHRPATAPSKRAGASKKKSSVYVDHEGFPVHRDQAWAETASDSDEEIDSQNLRELDPYIMNNITLNMSPEERRSNSPYKVDLTLPPEPRPPTRAPPGSRKTPRVSSSRSVITKDGRRIRPKSNKGSLSLHRKEPAYPHAAQQQTLCDVTIKYRGSNLKLQYERQDKRDEIVINQQHCGGGNLVVFHGLVEPGTDLVFTSRRHRGYPFSLTFFLNQIQVLRLSACCEYKYGPGVLLGGRKGHFKFGRVDGGSPCYRCMVEAELARRERQRYKDTQTEEPKPEPEPEPILESQGTQSDPPPPETRDQNEQAEGERKAGNKRDVKRDSKCSSEHSKSQSDVPTKSTHSNPDLTRNLSDTRPDIPRTLRSSMPNSNRARVSSDSSEGTCTSQSSRGSSCSPDAPKDSTGTSDSPDAPRDSTGTSGSPDALEDSMGTTKIQLGVSGKNDLTQHKKQRNKKLLKSSDSSSDSSSSPSNGMTKKKGFKTNVSQSRKSKGRQNKISKSSSSKVVKPASETNFKKESTEKERKSDSVDSSSSEKPNESKQGDGDRVERKASVSGSDTSVSEDLPSSFHYTS